MKRKFILLIFSIIISLNFNYKSFAQCSPSPTINVNQGNFTNTCPNINYVYTTQSGMTNYVWTISSGGVITSGATTNSITVNWTTPGPQTIKISFTNGSGCTPSSPTTENITVLSTPTVTVNGNPTAEQGSFGNTYTTDAGKSSYYWILFGDPPPLTTTGITSGQGTNSINVNWSTVGVNYAAVAYPDPGTGCFVSGYKSVTVTSRPTITGNLTTCQGATYTYNTESNKSSYNWSITGGTITSGAGTSIVTVVWNTPGSQTLSVNYATGTIPSSTVTKNIFVGTTPPTPTILGNSVNVCPGYPIVYTANPGMLSYSWNISQGGFIISGGTGIPTNTITVVWQTAGNHSVTVNFYSSCITTTTTKAVSVLSVPTPIINGSSSCVPVGSTNNLYTTTTGKSPYTWSLFNTNGTPANAQITSGNGTNQVLVTWPSAENYIVGVSYLDDVSGCTTMGSLAVSVKQIPAITNLPSTNSICSGQSIIFIPTANTNIANTTFSWTASTSSTISGTNSSGFGNIASILTNSGTTPGTVTYTITPSLAGCDGTPLDYVVTVKPKPVMAWASQNICSGQTTNIPLTSNVIGTTFSWPMPTQTNATGGYADTDSVINQTLTSNPSTESGTVKYNVTPTADGCVGDVILITAIVSPPILITNSILTTSICSGESIHFVPTSDRTGVSYNWTSTVLGSVTGVSPSGTGSIMNTLTNTGITNATVTYTITPVLGGCGVPVNYVVTVKPKPSITTSSQVTCSGQSTNIPLTSNVAGTTFSWPTPILTSAIGGTAGSGSTITQTLISNLMNSVGTATYAITPTANGCNGNVSNVVVTINPIPVINNPPVTNTICSGESINFIPTSNVAGTTFTWTSSVSGTITGASTSGSGPITNTLTNTGTTNGTVTYKITPSLGNCNGASVNYIVTVNPLPVASPLNQTICSGLTSIALNSNVNGTTFSWPAPTQVGTAGGGAGTGSSINQVLTNDSNTVPGTITYLVTPSINGCIGSSTTVVITVKKKPVVNIDGPSDFCAGSNAQLYANVQGNNCMFLWSNGITNAFNFVTVAGTYSVTVTSLYNGCSTTSSSFTVNPPIQSENGGTINASPLSCINSFDGSSPLTLSIPPIAGATYQWTPTGANTPSIAITTPGNHTVIVTPPSGSQIKGCYDAYYCAVRMAQPEFNDEENNNARDITIEQQSTQFTYYPNPANESLTFELQQKASKRTPLKMFDVNGHRVYDTSFEQGERIKIVNTRELTGGVYLIQVETGSNTIRKKVMIVHGADN